MDTAPPRPDAPAASARGRGAGVNPANRFEPLHLEVLDETREEAARTHPDGIQVLTEVIRDGTRSIINRVDSPDLPFHWTLNPYRGCSTGCSYCYARPTHEMLGFSCGLDFETKIVAKTDAARLLARELAAPSWHGEPIVMSGVTDCYQPLEKRLRITRGCLEVMAACRQPVSIVTKSRLVTRDIDLLKTLAESRAVTVAVSVTTLDRRLAARMEPRASAPSDRLRAISELTGAGIPSMAMVAPIIPGLTDREIPAILEAAAAAGAITASWVMLRLPLGVKDVFADWLAREETLRAEHVLSLMRQVSGGEVLYNPAFGKRGRGTGPIAEQIRQTFNLFRHRHGLDRPMPELSSASFARPETGGQLGLFNGTPPP